MAKKFGKRMDGGGIATALGGGSATGSRYRRTTTTRDADRRTSWSAREAERYGDKFARLKEKYPSYNWGAAPKSKQEYKSMWESFRDWRKDNHSTSTPRPDPRAEWLKKNFGQIEGFFKDPTSFFSSDLFKRLNPQAANAWAQYRSSMNTTPAQTPAPTAPVTTPSGVAAPGLQKNWADTVKSYFPQTMKAGGLVRGGGAAQRGVGKGKMR